MRVAPAVVMALLAVGAPAPAAALRPFYLYNVASATGVVGSNWARLVYDRKADELFVIYEGIVRIYNRAGMEVHAFGGDADLGTVSDLAVLDGGDMVVLANVNGKRSLRRCDFRGEPQGPFQITGMPDKMPAPTDADALAYAGGKLYLWLPGTGRALVTDAEGRFQAIRPVVDLLKLDPKQRGEAGIRGFSVDDDGNVMFTMPNLFRAVVISATGEVRQFGVKGSTPGKFNIAGNMVSDEKGNLFVTDRLRSVVMVFDRFFNFQGEFGYRGDDVDNLIAPLDIAVGNGKVFVAQARNRGVSVFRVEF